MTPTSIFLGAGFSCVAGLPITRDFFDVDGLPQAASERAARNHEEVKTAWAVWKQQNPTGSAEEWLLELHRGETPLLGTTYARAMAFALARLVPKLRNTEEVYYHGITNSVECQAHRTFWQRFLKDKYNVRDVITTNYDILPEQGLRREYSPKRSLPLFHYGGFPKYQVVRAIVNVTAKTNEWGEKHSQSKVVLLQQRIRLYKLHGSLNWVYEPDDFVIHEDVRGAFRSDHAKWQTAVIPPVPEKEMPPWLANVWYYAERSLSASDNWIVCGYSMPPYDQAIRDMLHRAADRVGRLVVWLLDPDSEALKHRWLDICPRGTVVNCLPGLPEAVADKHWTTFRA